MAGYGNNINNTLGIITAGVEVMPKQASKVARGWRTIGANIVKLASETDTFTAANDRVSVSLKSADGNLRSTYDLMKDLYLGRDSVTGKATTAWKDLSNEEKSNIALKLAGKSHMEVFKATLDNYTSAINANKAAQNAQGSAMEENDKFLDSIQGHIAQFQSAWEELSYHLMNSEGLKNIIDLGTIILKILDKIQQAIGTGGLLFTLGSLAVGFKILNKSIATKGLFDLGSALGGVGTAAKNIEKAGSIPAIAGQLGGLTGIASALLPIIGAVAGAFGVIKGLEWLGDLTSSDKQYEKLEKYESKISDIEAQIEVLNQKKTDGSITAAEQEELDKLTAQLGIIEKKRDAQEKYVKSLTISEGGHKKSVGKAEESKGLTGDTFKDITATQNKLNDLQEKKDKLLSDFEAGKSKLSYEEFLAELDRLNEGIDSAEDNFKDLSKSAKTNLDMMIDLWGTDSQKFAHYSKEIKDAYSESASAYLATLSDVGQYRDALNQLPENLQVKIQAVDEDGKLQQIDLTVEQLKGLSDTQLELLYKFEESGDSEFIDDILKGLDKDSEVYKILYEFSTEGKEQVEEEKNELGLPESVDVRFKKDPNTYNTVVNEKQTLLNDGTATIHFGATVSETLKTWWNRLKSLSGKKQGLAIDASATGKSKGQPGGLSWIGDEGNSIVSFHI